MAMRMSWILLYLITCQQISLAIPIVKINNAIFGPIDASYWLANLSNIISENLCICQCYQTPSCITVNYYGQHQQCILISVILHYEELQIVTTDEHASVISFGNLSHVEVSTTASTSIITTTGTVLTTTSCGSSTVITNTNTSCTVPTSTAMSYTTSPTTYEQQIYNYTALFTGIATLEFGFKAKNPAKTWHLDDVSILDQTASNTELIVNGGFECGSLNGWQVLCSSVNCGGTGGVLVQVSCYSGSYCYEGACQGAYDFLRQSFPVISGHVYTLSFWLYTDGQSAEAAYVTIR